MSMEQQRKGYFLGANTGLGFQSYYQQILHHPEVTHCFVVKGGTRQGKDYLFQQVARGLEEEGCSITCIYNPKDTSLLDGLICPQRGIAFVDGSLPHPIEADLPLGQVSYLDMGRCYDKSGLGDVRADISQAMEGYTQHYRQACHSIWAAAELSDVGRQLFMDKSLQEKLQKKSLGILHRECPPKKGTGQGIDCFLTAITPKGMETDWSLVNQKEIQVYQLVDRYGLGDTLLSHLAEGAGERGYHSLRCHHPLHPERRMHLILPEVGIAFVTSTPHQPYEGDVYRRIRLDALIDQEIYRQNKARLRFSYRIAQALLEEGAEELAQCQQRTEQVEQLYAPYFRPEMASKWAEELVGDR